MSQRPPLRQVRAVFDAETITVYQAYTPAIADAALAAGSFVPPFKLDRMTWIKPSFLWMMYRCGWATKPGQERVLAVRISRAGFEEALSQSCLSHFDPAIYPDQAVWEARKLASPVRIQWDPERTIALDPLPWRSLQVGLKGSAARHYASKWIAGITDVTAFAHQLHATGQHDPEIAERRLPPERPYPLPTDIAKAIGATG